MAREFAQIKLSIWSDNDWRDLSPDARYLYMTLLTSPTLTYCGTADWRPARIGGLNGQSLRTISEAGAELAEALYLVIDEATEEVLVRSFIRNDGLMKQPRMAVSMVTAHSGVSSQPIRGVVIHELRRLREDSPDLSGWANEKAADLLQKEPIDPETFPLGSGPFGGPFTPGLGETDRSVWGSPTTTTTPATATSRLTPSKSDPAPASAVAVPDTFAAFWDTYDKKQGRKAAEAAYRAALKKSGVTSEQIIEAASEYVEWQKVEGKHPTYTKNAATWLRGEHWNDERSAREAAKPRTKLDGFRDVHAELVARGAEQSPPPDLRQIGGSR